MEHKIINTESYLLIVDESEIKEGDTYCRIDTGLLFSSLKGSNPNIIEKYCKKIIAHLPLNNSPILEGVPLLPPLEDEVDKLAEDSAEDVKENHADYRFREVYKEFYKEGYNKAKEKYKYTEKQLDDAISWATTKAREGIITHWDIDNFIQSLQQPKMPVGFKREFLENKLWGQKGTGVYITETNSQGNTQWVGEYIYD